MNKLYTFLTLALAGVLGLASGAGAQTTPVVDHAAEAQSLFTQYAPVAVAVILAAAGFVITMKLLGAVVRKVSGVVGKL